MAENLNPFEEKDDQENIKIPQIETPDINVTCVDSNTKLEQHDITWDNIASKLLRDNFVLTALELYTELVESGRELPRLREYFSNPGNFERTNKDSSPSPTLARSSSVQTFDSLDFTRYSDDGERQVDERVAVLEFKLRAAEDTIKSLKSLLTKQTENLENVSSTENQHQSGVVGLEDETLGPVERKALNFLVNEYLLQADYKVTSITFAEENNDQDFEDWDDVGLNIARPPSLSHLLKDYGSHVSPQKDCQHACVEANIESQEFLEAQDQWKSHTEELENRLCLLDEQLRIALQENEILTQQVDILKIRSTDKPDTFFNKIKITSLQTLESEQSKENGVREDEEKELEVESRDNQTSERKSRNEEKTASGVKGDNDYVDAMGERGEGEGQEGESSLMNHKTSDALLQKRKMTPSFRKALLDVAFHVSRDNHIVAEMSRINQADGDKIVKMLACCLPHIVPNVLLAKREELIPVILSAAIFHPEAKERDNLLNILFNLIKKPDDEQRQVILTGCVVFAEQVGADRLVEELLPQCWEQIGHKYKERRLLVAEACGALAEYLPAEIRSSLVLSMLQQMLADEQDEEVREAVVKSLGLLMGYICDTDKYIQGYELLMTALKDPKEKVLKATLHVFLPALGMWARELGRLEHHLVHNFLKQLEDTVKGAVTAQKTNNSTSLPLNESRFLLLMTTLQELIPLLYLTAIETCPASHQYSDSEIFVDTGRFPRSDCPLNDLLVMSGGDQALSQLMVQFEGHISQEWFQPWEELNWIVNNLLPRMLEVTMTVGLSMQKVVHSMCDFMFTLCRTFGRAFTEKKVKWKFEEIIEIPDDSFEKQVNNGHLAVTTCIVPVYACGVLMPFFTEEDQANLTQFLKRVLCTLAFCQQPLDSLRATLIELSKRASLQELLLTVLWDGVVHSSAQVRAAAASLFELMIKAVSDVLVSSRIVPALVTLANDQDMSVRISTIPSLGAVIETITTREVLDRVYMQLQMFFDDPAYRDQHAVHVELINTLARCGPSAEPKFRDEFILPRLAALASANNQLTNETRRTDIAMQLFEAYTAISCCYLSEQLIAEAMLPGLRCLRLDMEAIEAEHEPVVAAMIKDYQAKLEAKSGSSDDLRTVMMSKFKDTTAKANITNIFTRKK